MKKAIVAYIIVALLLSTIVLSIITTTAKEKEDSGAPEFTPIFRGSCLNDIDHDRPEQPYIADEDQGNI